MGMALRLALILMLLVCMAHAATVAKENATVRGEGYVDEEDGLQLCIENGECKDLGTASLGSGIKRRMLRGRGRRISYDALKKDSVPCGRRGQSYYDCNSRSQVNPYRRGCSAITRCARDLH